MKNMTKEQAALIVTALEVLSGDLSDGFYFDSIQHLAQHNAGDEWQTNNAKPEKIAQLLLAFPQMVGVTDFRDVSKYDLQDHVETLADEIAQAHGLRSTFGDENVNNKIDEIRRGHLRSLYASSEEIRGAAGLAPGEDFPMEVTR